MRLSGECIIAGRLVKIMKMQDMMVCSAL